MDRIKLVDLRGVLHARFGEWQQAEADFVKRFSLSIASPL
jgi:hypothetical protein